MHPPGTTGTAPAVSQVRRRHDVSVISAPVFDHRRRQAMMVLSQIGRAHTDAEITKRARSLVALTMR